MAFDQFGRLFAVDNDPDSRPPCRLLAHRRGRRLRLPVPQRPQGTAPFHGLERRAARVRWGWSPAPARPRAACSPTSRTTCPRITAGTLLVTSWGDHRIERYRLEPRGASFRAIMKPVVVGGEDFRPVGIADGTRWHTLYQRLGQQVVHAAWQGADLAAAAVGRASAEVPHRVTASDSPEAETELRGRARPRSADRDKDGRTRLSPSRSSCLESAIRAMAVRIMPANRFDLKAIAVADASPLVRAEAMRRLADPTAKDLFLKALDSDDPFIQQAARLGSEPSLTTDELVALAGAPRSRSASQRLGLAPDPPRLGSARGPRLLPRFLADADPLDPVRGDPVGR